MKKIIYFMILAATLVSLFYISNYKNQTVNSPSNPVLPGTKSAPSLAPSPTPSPIGIGPIHQNIKATVFWVGEEAGEDNDFITNEISFWDKAWQQSYGGVDDPDRREGYFPKGFVPSENPFYFALPYADYDSARNLKVSVQKIPWFSQMPQNGQSIIKNRWIMIGYKDKVCFAQWEDVGPGQRNDFDYVFGKDEPQNDFTGIDLSPAMRDCLEMGDRAKVTWQFIDEKNVPPGPWKQIITVSSPNRE